MQNKFIIKICNLQWNVYIYNKMKPLETTVSCHSKQLEHFFPFDTMKRGRWINKFCNILLLYFNKLRFYIYCIPHQNWKYLSSSKGLNNYLNQKSCYPMKVILEGWERGAGLIARQTRVCALPPIHKFFYFCLTLYIIYQSAIFFKGYNHE